MDFKDHSHLSQRWSLQLFWNCWQTTTVLAHTKLEMMVPWKEFDWVRQSNEIELTDKKTLCNRLQSNVRFWNSWFLWKWCWKSITSSWGLELLQFTRLPGLPLWREGGRKFQSFKENWKGRDFRENIEAMRILCTDTLLILKLLLTLHLA